MHRRRRAVFVGFCCACLVVGAACSGAGNSGVGAPSDGDAGGAGSGTGDASPSVDAAGDDDATSTDAGVDAADAADAACVDTTSDALNCGACGYACLNGRACVASRCTPAWQPLSTTNVPQARDRHAATSLGTKYVATGGTLTFQGSAIAAAVSYDLASDTWATFPSHVAARVSHILVTVGSTIYAYGGITDAANGASIGPGLESSAAGGAWTALSPASPPHPRYNFAMAWTGTSLMIYGGADDATPANATGATIVPGAAWVDASCALTGCERGGYYTLFLDGAVMHVFGGGPFGDAPAGLEYDLATSMWSAWTVPPGGPDVSEMPKQPADDGRRIYWVREPATCTDPPSVLIYDRKTKTWSSDTAAPPTGLLARGAPAWVGGELVTWSGDCGSGGTTVGGRYQPPAPPP